MTVLWDLVLKLGLYALEVFIADMAKRAAMKKSFEAFVQNRKARSVATIELKENVEAQEADLDAVQKEKEAPDVPKD